jgi:hypothetical protein
MGSWSLKQLQWIMDIRGGKPDTTPPRVPTFNPPTSGPILVLTAPASWLLAIGSLACLGAAVLAWLLITQHRRPLPHRLGNVANAGFLLYVGMLAIACVGVIQILT